MRWWMYNLNGWCSVSLFSICWLLWCHFVCRMKRQMGRWYFYMSGNRQNVDSLAIISITHVTHTQTHEWSMNTLHIHVCTRTLAHAYITHVCWHLFSAQRFAKSSISIIKLLIFITPQPDFCRSVHLLNNRSTPTVPYHTLLFIIIIITASFLSFFLLPALQIDQHTVIHHNILHIFFLFILLSFGASICRSDLDSSDIQIRDEINILSIVNSVYTKTDWDFFSFQWVISM